MTEQKKTLAAIAEEITATAKKINEIKNEIEKSENEFFALDDNTQTKYLLDTPKEARIMRKWEEQRKEVERLENLKKIFYNNYYIVLFENLRPVLISVLKKYNGKKAGEKTVEKMQNEIREASGVYVYFRRACCSQRCFNILASGKLQQNNIDIYASGRKNFILDDNTINGELLADDLYISTYREYIYNPAERLDEIEKARATVEEAKKQYNEAVLNYDNLIVNGFEVLQKIYK